MKNQVVIVTGAGRGIGACVADFFARDGARVVIAERDEAAGHRTEAGIRDGGGQALFVRTDVGLPEEIERLYLRVREVYGGVDVLVNNAGFGRAGSLHELTVDDWDAVMNTNLRGAFLCAREAALSMRERGGGAIINVASIRARTPDPLSIPYAASKAGVIGLTRALATALAPDGIRVNSVSPGWIETGEGTATAGRVRHEAGVAGAPQDIAKACRYLADPENRFITGADLVVDGGITRRLVFD